MPGSGAADQGGLSSRQGRLQLPGGGQVSTLLLTPTAPSWFLVFGHGAGAGMEHPFMEEMARRLAQHGGASLRYQFPYMERGSRRPDARALLLETVRAAVDAGAAEAAGLPLLAGGKSMGGRMTSQAAAEGWLQGIAGLVFLGFPLHPAGRPALAAARAEHLQAVTVPMLFVQGSRDRLAELDLVRLLCRKLGRRACLHETEGADHGFQVLKRSGRDAPAVLDEAAAAVAAWAARLAAAPNQGRRGAGR